MGIGDWGLGIGDWGLGPIPNPQSPIPNPQSPSIYNNYIKLYIIIITHEYIKYFSKLIINHKNNNKNNSFF